MKRIIGLICLLLLVGCSINGQEEINIETNESRIWIGKPQLVSEDMYCVCPDLGCMCFSDTILIELDKGVFALNLPYFRKANTSWKDNATKVTD